MADHGEVEYATATGNDYAAHESSYENFLKLTEVTILTHPAPRHLGMVVGQLTARSDAAYRKLLESFLRFYRVKLMGEGGGLIIAAACFAGGIGAFTQLGWKAPGLIFAIALIVWPLA